MAVSDVVAKEYYDFYRPGKLADFDLILACGDLKRRYLEFLVTMARCPLLYVRGNHDDGLREEPPEGCVCIEDRIYNHEGIRILGLGGSYQYRLGDNMYTEGQMERRILRQKFRLWRGGGLDILLTHAPARHLNDMDDLAHRGFECFTKVMDQYRPKYFIHGHIHHSYSFRIPRRCTYGATTVINACGSYVFEY